jgi:hypothetical protein
VIAFLARLDVPDVVAPLAPAPADLAVLRDVVSRTRVDRVPAGPSLGEYTRALAEAFGRWLGGAFDRTPGLAGGLELAARIAALAVLAAALCLIAISLWRGLRRWARPRGATVPHLEWRVAPGPERIPLDRETWGRRLEERLASGDLAGALEALWWWVAASLSLDEGVEPSWTTRELLARAGRPELAPAASSLDVLMYGRAPANAAEIRACRTRLEEVLP